MMNFVTFLRMAGYFIILFTPITYVIVAIILKIIKKKIFKLSCIVISSYIAVFFLYICGMYFVPYHTGGVTNEDAEKIASMIQIHEDESNTFDLTVKPDERYLANEFGIGYYLDEDEGFRYSTLGVEMKKFYDVEEAKAAYSRLVNNQFTTITASRWENPEGTIEIGISVVETEKEVLFPPYADQIRYIADIYIRCENYVLRFHSYTMGENLNLKHAIFFLLEKNPNLEYWLTHNMSFNQSVDGTILDYDPELVDPREEERWIYW